MHTVVPLFVEAAGCPTFLVILTTETTMTNGITVLLLLAALTGCNPMTSQDQKLVCIEYAHSKTDGIETSRAKYGDEGRLGEPGSDRAFFPLYRAYYNECRAGQSWLGYFR